MPPTGFTHHLMFLSERMPKKKPSDPSPTISKRFLHASSVKEAHAERGVILTRVLHDDSMRERLQAKLDKNHTGEGLAFVTAVENLQMPSTSPIQASESVDLSICPSKLDADMTLRDSIMEEFILDSAPAQINLTDVSRTKLVKSFRRHGSSFESPDLFNDAYQEVMSDIQHSDVFSTFIRKDEKEIKALVIRLQGTSIGVAL